VGCVIGAASDHRKVAFRYASNAVSNGTSVAPCTRTGTTLFIALADNGSSERLSKSMVVGVALAAGNPMKNF